MRPFRELGAVAAALTLVLQPVPAAATTPAAGPPVRLAADVPRTVVYGPDTNDQNYDVTFPATAGTSRAWVVTVHGGSWAAGAKSSIARTASKLNAAGFVVFNVEYRRSSDYVGNPGAPWPAQRNDVLAAVDHIRANAADYGVDPGRGAVYGFSAGGHIAAAAALQGRGTDRLRALVSVAGPVQPWRVDVVAQSDPATGYGGDLPTAGNRTLSRWAAVLFRCPRLTWTDCQARWTDGLPETHASAGDPASWLVQGTSDTAVPPASAGAFAYHLRAAGLSATVTTVSRAGHDELALLTGDTAAARTRWSAMITWLRARTA